MTPRPYGIILAGGRASRMGGDDKAMLRLAGRPLVAHVVARLEPQCRGLVVSANGDPQRFAAFGLPVVADAEPFAAGPLGGILACLDWIADRAGDCQAALSVPVDTPFLPPDLALRLAAASSADGMAQAASGGRNHPVVALWRPALRPVLREALQQPASRRVGAFLARQACAVVDWPTAPRDPFFNINGPQDLAAAEAMLGAVDP